LTIPITARAVVCQREECDAFIQSVIADGSPDPRSAVEVPAEPDASLRLRFGVESKVQDGGGEEREDVLFIDCSAFGNVAKTIDTHFKKGKPIFVEGRLKLDQWEDKNGGGKRSKISAVVEGFRFVGGPPRTATAVGVAQFR
jgi:single-strand DNA-binding protein